jgi:hypothetical protein
LLNGLTHGHHCWMAVEPETPEPFHQLGPGFAVLELL